MVDNIPNTQLCIIVTEHCNLRCKYCYMKPNPESISEEVIDQILTFITPKLKSGEMSYNLDLFGGEALICEDKVKYFIEQAEKRVGEYFEKGLLNFSILTNGTTLTEDFLRYAVTKPFVRFCFSLDGNQASHDSARVYADGSGSFNDVMNKLKLYSSIYNVPLAKVFENVRWTVSSENVAYMTDAANELLEMGIHSISPAFVKEGWTEESLKILDEQLLNLGDIYINNIDKGVYSSTFLLPETYNRYDTCSSKYRKFCGAGSNHFSISPTGNIYPCQRFYSNRNDEFIIGDIWKGFYESYKWRIFFKNISSANFPKCSKCKIEGIEAPANCEGQCIAGMFEINKSLTQVIETTCELRRIVKKHTARVKQAIGNHPSYNNLLEHMKRGNR